ncbi:MAG: hypothetical protein G01um101418_859 [Parcubacteria group bacterium Gr01-1014_18]|nr:MAG: hypothetical protein Greene041636_819 [Parcubacteria group bacterium Greene0416_36]TSC79860.1 MAG: hypothetical protein G01um101418_859 [Parcubacteria group bacterium Gr01-1014_18]TSC98292.1 MAG: hypothetical protein Greene101420_796 [Parcubacteria group bacterium Greene1014_20]TSD06667.1 MAG: hypothetical protein Greene07142_719 [Parcubacteria group bacterium Greene0714_2]
MSDHGHGEEKGGHKEKKGCLSGCLSWLWKIFVFFGVIYMAYRGYVLTEQNKKERVAKEGDKKEAQKIADKKEGVKATEIDLNKIPAAKEKLTADHTAAIQQQNEKLDRIKKERELMALHGQYEKDQIILELLKKELERLAIEQKKWEEAKEFTIKWNSGKAQELLKLEESRKIRIEIKTEEIREMEEKQKEKQSLVKNLEKLKEQMNKK